MACFVLTPVLTDPGRCVPQLSCGQREGWIRVDFGVTYTPEQERFRSEVSSWLAGHVPPGINKRARSDEESAEVYRLRRELGRELGKKGWLYPAAPAEYGGGGLSAGSVVILEEEARRYGIGLPPYYDSGGVLGSASIRVWGTDEQKGYFLPAIYRGEVRTWQLLTEPTAGSDLAGVRMTAVRDGDEYILNGQKVFVGSNHGADRLWVIAVTDPSGARHQNVSWFMIDADLPGIEIQPQYLLQGTGEGDLDTGHKNTIYFTDVRVPAFSLIGDENQGWKVASTHLEIEHGGMGTIHHSPVWPRLLEFARSTRRDGRRLVDDPRVQSKLAQIYTQLQIVWLMSARNSWQSAVGAEQSYEGSQQSYLRKVVGLWLTKEIAEIAGPAALTDDDIWGAMGGHAERQQRDGIVDTHPGGTTDIQRVIIARRLGLGKRPREQSGRTR